MSRENGVHYSYEKQYEILKEAGLNCREASKLVNVIVELPFENLDMLYKAIGKIKKGA